MKTPNSGTRIILVVAVILLSVALLASVFAITGSFLTGSLGNQSIPSGSIPITNGSSALKALLSQPIVSNNSAISLSSTIPTSFENLSDTPVFSITGVTGNAYIRCSVGDYYSDGSWYSDSGYTGYNGGAAAEQAPYNYVSKTDMTVQISPDLHLVDFIPSFKDTQNITYPANLAVNLLYFGDDQAFYSQTPISNKYDVSYSVYSFNSTLLEGATVSDDSRYLGVPANISAPLEGLADSITANASTPYDKAMALETYLKANYQYSFNITPPQNGMDPVLWFLFHDKEGVCIQFNSAFVLLARSVGLPARLVIGYLIDPSAPQQTVDENQAHAYSEILFNGLGWVTFDATGGSDTGSTDSLPPAVNTTGSSSGSPITLTSTVSTSNDPVFIISGVTGTNFTRDSVGDEYNNGVWTSNSSGATSYTGQQIPQPNGILVNDNSNTFGLGISVYQMPYYQSVTISPIVPMQTSIETMSYALQLNTTSTTLSYYADDQIFATSAPLTDEYTIFYYTYSFTPSELDSATVSPSSMYTNVPSSIAQNLTDLAINITAGAATPYEKAVALESYLQSNYQYSLENTAPPNGTDPILWFLFQSKEGNYVDFNSAFALLARSIGIPARVVSGYMISPTAPVQTVLSKNAYTYAEVLFDNLGWVAFDAAPSGAAQLAYNLTNQPGSILTNTNITSISDLVGLEGHNFSVNGTVEDNQGNPVSGLNIVINLTDGNTNNVIVGEGTVVNGAFSITCNIPTGIAVGQYQVVAQALGNGVYNGSISDPRITIGGDTTIAFWTPQESIIDEDFNIVGQITGTESGQGLADVPLTVACGNETINLVTDSNGEFSLDMNLTSFGMNNVTVSFTGQLQQSNANNSTGSSNDSEYYLSSSATRQVVVPTFSIEALSENLIRGENNLLMCRLMAGSIPVSGESVQVTLNSSVYSGITNNEGYVSSLSPVPAGYPLGNATLLYAYTPYNVTSSQTVKIMARTFIEVSSGGGNPLRINVKLVNDLGEPVANQPLLASLNSTGETFIAYTNSAGVTILKTSVTDLRAINGLDYLVNFNGSDFLLPSSASGKIQTSNELAPVLMALIGAAAIPPLLLVVRKRSLPSTSIRRDGGAVTEPSTAAAKNGSHPIGCPWWFEISFPGILPPLPNTFGVGETVKVTIKTVGAGVTLGEIFLSIDGKAERKLAAGAGRVGSLNSVELSLEKGDHILSIMVDNKKIVEVPVRMVDYREETVRLYNEYFNAVKGQNLSIAEGTTPREFELIYRAQLPVEKQASLDEVTSVFEVSNYSMHTISRSDFMRIYIRLAELRSSAGV